MSRFSKRLVLVGFWIALAGVGGCSSSTHAIALPDADADTKEKEKEVAKDEKPGAPFRLPGDETGKILAKVLPPTAPPTLLRNPKLPAPPPGPRMPLRLPETALPGVTAELMRLPIPANKGLTRPDFLLEESLEESFDSPIVPKIPSFVTGRLSQVASEDVAIAPTLPLMATPLSAQVSLDDATGDASTAAVLSAELPGRSTPVPFALVTRPEPYENVIPLTFEIPEDEATPPTATPELKR